MKKFPYENGMEKQGILNYLQKKYKEKYFNYVKPHASSTLNAKDPIFGIFNYSKGYWFSDSVSDNHITFCFPYHEILLSGYQLYSGTGTCLLNKWSMSGMNVPEEYENTIEVTEKVAQGKSYYKPYGKGPYKCFKLILIGNSQCGLGQTDIQFIELYGTLYSNIEIKATKCLQANNLSWRFVFLLSLCS